VKKNTTSSEERITSRAAASETALAYRAVEAAKICGVSERTIQRLISTRELPSVRIGAIRMIRRAALEKFLASRESA